MKGLTTEFFAKYMNQHVCFVVFQAGELKTVELNVNMHCEACAQELKRKILKMRGTIMLHFPYSV